MSDVKYFHRPDNKMVLSITSSLFTDPMEVEYNPSLDLNRIFCDVFRELHKRTSHENPAIAELRKADLKSLQTYYCEERAKLRDESEILNNLLSLDQLTFVNADGEIEIVSCDFDDIFEWIELFKLWCCDPEKSNHFEVMIQSCEYSVAQTIIDMLECVMLCAYNHNFNNEVDDYLVKRLKEDHEISSFYDEYIRWDEATSDLMDSDFDVVKGHEFSLLIEE